MKSYLPTIAGILVGLAAGAILTPAALNLAEKQKQAQSAHRLLIASRALQTVEQELGYIPITGWEEHAGGVVGNGNFDDPNRDPRTTRSGWGINTRTQLRAGSADPDPEGRNSKTMPPDAILLMAWHQETFTPKRTGSPNIPIDDTGQPSDPRSRHGKKTPVCRVDGSMALLTINEINNELRLRHQPESIKGQEALSKKAVEIEQKMETDRNGHTSFPGYVTLERGKITTPKIPDRGKLPSLSFEAQSPIHQEVAANIIFLNKDGREINYSPNSTRTWIADTLYIHQPEWRSWTVRHPEKFQKPGFNPYLGAAEIAQNTCYQKGTEIVETTDFRVRKTTMIGEGWTPIEIKADQIPEFTEYFQIEFEKAGKTPVIIKNIRIRFE